MQSSSSNSPTNSNGFDRYYREFSSVIQQLEATSDSNKKDDLQKQCVDLLSLMALEARTTDCPDTEFERLERVKIYKFQYEAVRNQHDKEFLMGSKATNMLSVEKAKERLQQAETRAAQQNELLIRAQRSLHETEQTGASIMTELHGNRESIESAQRHTDEVNSLGERASKLVKSLSRPWWLPRR